MDGDEGSMEGRTRGDGTFWSDCKDVVGCLYVCLRIFVSVSFCVCVCVHLRVNVDDCVRGE